MRDYKVSVVIPVYGKWDLLHQLLSGLARYEKENIDEVIVVDDCYSDISGLIELHANPPISFSIYGNSENLGFTKSSNIGLQIASKEVGERRIVFLISSDVKVSGKFIYQAEDILFGARRHFIGNRHIIFNSGWNTFDGVTFDYLEGWFLACTSDGWKDLGYFDESYSPYDYEDIDISTTAKRKGYKLTSLNNPHVTHLGGGTIGFNPAREAITKRNQEYFRKKWLGDQ